MKLIKYSTAQVDFFGGVPMEPKMLEFPNPYCRDRDQGDLDDLIFAVGGPAGPSER